jgi:HK97 family phage major capsid protein
MTALQTCRQTLRGINDQIRGISETAEDEGRQNLLASETRKYATLKTERSAVEARIAQLEEQETRAVAEAKARGVIGDVGPAYTEGRDTVYSQTSGFSYFRDLMASATPGSSEAYEAQLRLNEHAQVIDRAAADLPAEFRAGPTKRAAGAETRVNPNRTDGQGGYFVPPLWVMEDAVMLLRAGRATADRCNVRNLPPGTDSINLPKVATGTTTAVQTADAAGVSSTDMTDTFVSGPVRTIAGQQDIGLQLLEQSPANFDEVVFADLIADYNQKLDIQVMSGSNAAGQVKGIFNVSGINTIAYTDATPTVQELWVPLTQSLSKVASLRFLPGDCIVMHPSRWYWIVGALDTTGRPLVSPEGGNGLNSLAVLDATAAEGVVGSIAGVPIVVDANMSVNNGAGTNQDRILTGRLKDAYLYEGALRTRALVEILSGNLQVRLQTYNYVALIADRYPTAYSLIDGTGLIVPAGY